MSSKEPISDGCKLMRSLNGITSSDTTDDDELRDVIFDPCALNKMCLEHEL